MKHELPETVTSTSFRMFAIDKMIMHAQRKRAHQTYKPKIPSVALLRLIALLTDVWPFLRFKQLNPIFTSVSTHTFRKL